jgi:hypothetical protein
MCAKNKTDEKGDGPFFIIFITHDAPWRVPTGGYRCAPKTKLMKRGRSFFHHFHYARRAMARPYRRLSIRAKNKTDEKGTVFFLSLSSRTTRHGASLQAAIDSCQKQNCNIPWTFTGQR